MKKPKNIISQKLRLRHRLYAFLLWLRSSAVRYALKIAFIAIVLALPAYFTASVATFNQIRGQWAIFTFIVVLSPSVGGTVDLSVWRIAGTILGAIWGYISWLAYSGSIAIVVFMQIFFCKYFVFAHLFGENVVLSRDTALAMFYIMLTTKSPGVGSVSLVTYSVIFFG